MFIAHLPMGYITGSLFRDYLHKQGLSVPKFLVTTSMVGAIIPDSDLLYFYLIDHRQHHHHAYFTHYPIVWIIPLILAWAWFLTKKTPYSISAVAFFSNAFIHLLLDSVVGDIWWLMPFVNRPFVLATVPNLYSPWWLNFILHWSFGLEIMILSFATYLFVRQKKEDIKEK